MFITQLTGTIIAGVVNYLTAIYLMDNIPHICTPQNTRWRCPNANIFFSASIIWGAIGKERFGCVLVREWTMSDTSLSPSWILISALDVHFRSCENVRSRIYLFPSALRFSYRRSSANSCLDSGPKISSYQIAQKHSLSDYALRDSLHAARSARLFSLVVIGWLLVQLRSGSSCSSLVETLCLRIFSGDGLRCGRRRPADLLYLSKQQDWFSDVVGKWGRDWRRMSIITCQLFGNNSSRSSIIASLMRHYLLNCSITSVFLLFQTYLYIHQIH